MTLPPDDGYYEYAAEPPPPQPRRRLFLAAGALLLLAVFAVGIWYAYRLGVEAGSDGDVPLIAADPQPAKVKPADPGGLEVPHQDVTVYQRFAQRAAKPAEEQLLPEPEQPLAKPPPLPAPAEPAAPEQPGEAAAPDAPQQGTAAPTAAAPEAERPAEPQPVPEAQVEQPVQPPPPPPAAAPAPPPAAPPAASGPAAGSGYRVQLASLRSEAEAREAWNRLKSRHSDLLGRLQLSLVRVDLGGGKGVFHRVQAGPLSEKMLADIVCSELKRRNVGCIVVQP